MTCPQCGADGLDYGNGHLVCRNPDCDFSEEIEIVTFEEKEDYYNQNPEPKEKT